jgi:hypothetical protein
MRFIISRFARLEKESEEREGTKGKINPHSSQAHRVMIVFLPRRIIIIQ